MLLTQVDSCKGFLWGALQFLPASPAHPEIREAPLAPWSLG